jgi:3' exoribonuclease, RNase T-like
VRVYYDLEFVERGRDIPIQLVSIGMVDGNGRTLYLVNEECLSNVARHPWLSVNVWPHLPARSPSEGILEWDTGHLEYKAVMALDRIAGHVRDFVTGTDDPELWAWYGAYDHVVLCQLFGSMAELPAGFPMYTSELVQEWNRLGCPELPKGPENTHHALADALWAQEAGKALDRVAGHDSKILEFGHQVISLVEGLHSSVLDHLLADGPE